MGFRIPVDAEVHCDECKESHELSMNLYAGVGGGVGTAGESMALPPGWSFWTNRWYRTKVLCPSCYAGHADAN